MSRGVRFSVLGLYRFDNTLFNSMHFPVGFSEAEKQTVITNILADTAELETLYPDFTTMSVMIGAWSAIELPVWQRIYDASKLEYNPIENYNRTELETISDDKTETHSGKDSTQHSGADSSTGSNSGTEAHSGTDTNTNSVTSYDSNSPMVHDINSLLHGESITTSGQGSSSTTYGRKEELTHGEKIVHEGDITRSSHISGNIGVTTSQQMIQQEIDIASALNVCKIIVESFRERFCLLVY